MILQDLKILFQDSQKYGQKGHFVILFSDVTKNLFYCEIFFFVVNLTNKCHRTFEPYFDFLYTVCHSSSKDCAGSMLLYVPFPLVRKRPLTPLLLLLWVL